MRKEPTPDNKKYITVALPLELIELIKQKAKADKRKINGTVEYYLTKGMSN